MLDKQMHQYLPNSDVDWLERNQLGGEILLVTLLQMESKAI